MSSDTPAVSAAVFNATALVVSRIVATVVHPARAQAMAVANPMPEDVPVIRTQRFVPVLKVALPVGSGSPVARGKRCASAVGVCHEDSTR